MEAEKTFIGEDANSFKAFPNKQNSRIDGESKTCYKFRLCDCFYKASQDWKDINEQQYTNIYCSESTLILFLFTILMPIFIYILVKDHKQYKQRVELIGGNHYCKRPRTWIFILSLIYDFIMWLRWSLNPDVWGAETYNMTLTIAEGFKFSILLTTIYYFNKQTANLFEEKTTAAWKKFLIIMSATAFTIYLGQMIVFGITSKHKNESAAFCKESQFMVDGILMGIMGVLFLVTYMYIKKTAKELTKRQLDNQQQFDPVIFEQREEKVRQLGVVAWMYLISITLNLIYSIFVFSLGNKQCQFSAMGQVGNVIIEASDRIISYFFWQFALIYLLWPNKVQLKKDQVYDTALKELNSNFNVAAEVKKQEALLKQQGYTVDSDSEDDQQDMMNNYKGFQLQGGDKSRVYSLNSQAIDNSRQGSYNAPTERQSNNGQNRSIVQNNKYDYDMYSHNDKSPTMSCRSPAMSNYSDNRDREETLQRLKRDTLYTKAMDDSD